MRPILINQSIDKLEEYLLLASAVD